MKRKVVLIIGMHRSGTSALTSLLSHAGLDVGKTIMPAAPDNPLGFFENERIVRLNNQLLKAYGATWDLPFSVSFRNVNTIDQRQFQNQLDQIIAEDFEGEQLVIKDPRISKLLPFYINYFQQAKYDVSFLVCLRSPLEIFRSLNNRQGISEEHAALLIYTYMRDAEYLTRGFQRVFVTYDDLLSDANSVLQRITDKLDIRLKQGDYNAINPRLRHFDTKKAEILSSSPAMQFALDQNAAMHSLSENDTKKLRQQIDQKFAVVDDFIQSILSPGSFPYNRLSGLVKNSLAYIDQGRGFGEWNAQFSRIDDSLPYYKATIKLNTRGTTLRIRWFPIHDNHVKINITRIYLVNLDGTERVLPFVAPENMQPVEGRLVFESNVDFLDFDINGVYDKFIIEGDYSIIQNSTWIQQHEREVTKVEQPELERLQAVESAHLENLNELDRSRAEIARFKENNEKLVGEVERLRDLENRKNGQLKSLIEERDELKNQKSQIQTDLDEKLKLASERSNQELQSLTYKYESEIEGQITANLNYRNDLLQKEKLLDNSLRALQEENSNLKEREEQNNELIAEQSNSISNLSQELEGMKSGTSQILESLNANKKKYKKLLGKYKALKKTNSVLSDSLSENQQQVAELNRQSANTFVELESVSSLLSEVERGHASYTSSWLEEKTALLEQIGELQFEIEELKVRDQLRHDLSEENARMEEEKWNENFQILKEKNQELDHLHGLCQQLYDKIHDKTQLFDTLRSTHEQLAKSYNDFRDTTDVKLTRREEQVEGLNREIDDYRRSVDDKSSEIKSQTLQIRNLESSLRAKKILIEDLKNDLLLTQQELLSASYEKQRYDNHLKAAMFQMRGVKNSLSYRLGFGLTSPLRFIYDKLSSQPFNDTAVGKSLVEKNELDSPIEQVVDINRVEVGSDSANLLSVGSASSAMYNAENVSFEDAPPHPPMKVDESKLANVLYISPNLPDYDESSGGKRATYMLKLLQEKHNVFVFTLGDKPKKYIDKLRSLDLNVLETSRFDKAASLMPKIDTIIYAWYYTYFDAAAFRDIYPDAHIIVDSVDVHWLREFRSIGLMKGLTKEKAQLNKMRELDAYGRAAIIWTVTEEDKVEVMKELPTADVRVVSNIHDMVEHKFVEKNSNSILFFGGYRHYPNISAAEILAKEILPKVRQEVPDAQLILAGSHAPPSIKELGDLDGVVYEGFIEDDQLNDLYNRSFLIAAPLQAGAGIKGKICEAIVHRTPVVTNAIGNEGINLINEDEALIAEENGKMAQYIADAMRGKFNLDQMTDKAARKLLKIVGPEVAKESMENSIYPEVSICVVTWNRLELLKKCCESVLEKTSYPKFKLLVHSNGCADGTREYLTALAKDDPRVVPILSDNNDVFVIPNNQMMDRYPENDVVLLNNDTIVTENWLSALHDVAYSDPTIGISGSKLLYPDGTLQEFGSELYADGTGRNIGKWEDPTLPQYNVVTEVGYVSGCSLYLKRSTLNKVGYFDEQFHPCYCEDSDLCYTAKEHGLRTMVTHESVIYHFEGGTSGTDTSSGMKRYQEINMKKFLAKHRGKDNGIDWTI